MDLRTILMKKWTNTLDLWSTSIFFVQEIEALERVDCKVQKIRPK